MATILRGKLRGKTAVIHQFANDWVTIDVPEEGIQGKVVSPTSLQLTADEVQRVRTAPRQADGLLVWNALSDDGRFTKV